MCEAGEWVVEGGRFSLLCLVGGWSCLVVFGLCLVVFGRWLVVVGRGWSCLCLFNVCLMFVLCKKWI